MVERIAAPGACRCTTCSAALAARAAETLLACPYCGTEQHMRRGRRLVDRDWAALEAEARRPQELVVPFAVDREGARLALRAWARGRRFAPRRLRRLDRAETLTSVYLPHWMWGARTCSHYTGGRGRHHWSVDGRGNRFRRTSWDPVRGTVSRSFAEVAVPATRSVPGRLLWGLAAGPAVPSRPELLAGHRVADCDVDPATGLAEAKLKMDELVRREVRRDIGGDAQRVRAVDTEYADLNCRLLLLPVWSVEYTAGGRPRQVLVDGRTGAVSGVRSWSAWKLGFVLALPFIVTAVASVILAIAD
ncbi:hypothetical protein [Glycomyces tenuis]|uniref:hypothetical protein n=1 Tax=Glycomyces tenuis TaxID=58116 RepID=UPI00041165D6|nr:hypothetical protein [Glycomyces tenuis]